MNRPVSIDFWKALNSELFSAHKTWQSQLNVSASQFVSFKISTKFQQLKGVYQSQFISMTQCNIFIISQLSNFLKIKQQIIKLIKIQFSKEKQT